MEFKVQIGDDIPKSLCCGQMVPGGPSEAPSQGRKNKLVSKHKAMTKEESLTESQKGLAGQRTLRRSPSNL